MQTASHFCDSQTHGRRALEVHPGRTSAFFQPCSQYSSKPAARRPFAFSTSLRLVSSRPITSANSSILRRVVILRDAECCRLIRSVHLRCSFPTRSILDFKSAGDSSSITVAKLLPTNFHSDFERSSRFAGLNSHG